MPLGLEIRKRALNKPEVQLVIAITTILASTEIESIFINHL